MSDDKSKDAVLKCPQLRLIGHIDEAMYAEFRNQLNAAPAEGPLVIALTTLGGDPEIARAMGADVRLLGEVGRNVHFLGKAAVYSAGATFMAHFPVANRFLTEGTRLMIHERQMSKSVELSGPLRSCVDQLKAALHEIEHSMGIEDEGFRQIVEGSKIDFEKVREKAPGNWYISSDEALEMGLVAGVI